MSTRRLHDIVKAYDVRGVVPDQLGLQECRALGAAFAHVVALPDGASGIVVGHDMRPSSPELSRAFAEGAADQGVDVTFAGLCSTDQLYFASGHLDRPGAMFTASHNPAQYNGIKLCRSAARPIGLGAGLDEVRDLAQWVLDRGQLHQLPTSGRRGDVTEQDLLGAYADHLLTLVDLSGSRRLRVVVDAGSGMAGLTVPAVLGRPGSPVEVVPLYFELDGTFPHHEANPLVPENLRDLQRAVLEHRADLGLAFDGDADRCAVVDEHGRTVSPSAIGALVADREIARAVAAGTPAHEVVVVHNAICSRSLPETVVRAGAQPVRSRVGHSYVKARMAEHGAVFGGEHSAHYYFRDFWFADSGMLAALHVLAAVGEQEGGLSALTAGYDRYAASGEVNSTVEDAGAATARVRAWGTTARAVAEDFDGLLLVHEAAPMWWLSLRASNTEPLLRLNVEAADRATMEQVRDTVLQEVRR